MTTSADQLRRAAEDAGFQADALEKVWQLMRLLDGIAGHPFLGARLALKGGTALNLFFSDVPRLSVDVDLNYIGAADRATMMAERPRVHTAIEQVAGRLGLSVRRAPSEHAGGKWRLSYATALGRPGALEIDVNFLLRVPLWPPVVLASRTVAGSRAHGVRVLDEHEVVAGKLVALLARRASRDLFDVAELSNRRLDVERLRLAFVVYGGANRLDWRTVDVADVSADAQEVRRHLLPVLPERLRPGEDQVAPWTAGLVEAARSVVGRLLPLRPGEVEFLDRLNDGGEIVPELLGGDDELRRRVGDQPGLAWKALNVRRHRGGKGQ